jgi:hypothetical protein
VVERNSVIRGGSWRDEGLIDSNFEWNGFGVLDVLLW